MRRLPPPPEPAKEAVPAKADAPAEDDPFGLVAPKAEQVVDVTRLPGGIESDTMRQWSDNTGLFKIEGRIAQITATNVRLIKDTGRYTTVPLRRLSAADYEFVAEQAKVVGIVSFGVTASR